METIIIGYVLGLMVVGIMVHKTPHLKAGLRQT